MPASEIYISVDIETDGPIPGLYSMLSIGAALVGQVEQGFYAELQPISEQFVPQALAVSGLDRERLRIEGLEPTVAMERFRAWLKSLGGRPVFVSFSSWDWVFVYYYLIRYTGSSPFGHSSLDQKSFYLGRFGSTWRETTKGRIARAQPALLAGLGPHTHHALDDAKEQAELFGRMLERAASDGSG